MIVLLGGQEQGAKTQGMGACSTGEYRNLTSFNLTAFKIATYFHILMNIFIMNFCFQWTGTPHWTGESDALVPIIVEPVVEVGFKLSLTSTHQPSPDTDTRDDV